MSARFSRLPLRELSATVTAAPAAIGCRTTSFPHTPAPRARGDPPPPPLIAEDPAPAGDQNPCLLEVDRVTHARIRLSAPATSSTWASVISGYIGSESSRSPCSSDAGKSPFLWPSSAKQGCRCTGTG